MIDEDESLGLIGSEEFTERYEMKFLSWLAPFATDLRIVNIDERSQRLAAIEVSLESLIAGLGPHGRLFRSPLGAL